MDKIPSDLFLPDYDGNMAKWAKKIINKLNQNWAAMAKVLNSFMEGRVSQRFTDTVMPTSGTWEKGDEVKNSNPIELGQDGKKYIVKGWLCISSGEPGLWVEMRFTTGN